MSWAVSRVRGLWENFTFVSVYFSNMQGSCTSLKLGEKMHYGDCEGPLASQPGFAVCSGEGEITNPHMSSLTGAAEPGPSWWKLVVKMRLGTLFNHAGELPASSPPCCGAIQVIVSVLQRSQADMGCDIMLPFVNSSQPTLRCLPRTQPSFGLQAWGCSCNVWKCQVAKRKKKKIP